MRDRLQWRTATVAKAIAETESARTLILDIEGWTTHTAGQHLDVRLTAPDGYQASRSYSLSSGPGEAPQITVERVDDGEVSPYLVDVVGKGEAFEVRGPIGGYFTWSPTPAANDKHEGPTLPLLLIGGGSGIAPLRAMWRAASSQVPVTVLYSAQTLERVIFAEELATAPAGIDVRLHLTRQREASTDDGAVAGRIGPETIAEALDQQGADVFVCGPTAFVEAMASHAVTAGIQPNAVRTERFG